MNNVELIEGFKKLVTGLLYAAKNPEVGAVIDAGEINAQLNKLSGNLANNYSYQNHVMETLAQIKMANKLGNFNHVIDAALEDLIEGLYVDFIPAQMFQDPNELVSIDLKVDVSLKNEMNAAPFWIIIDGKPGIIHSFNDVAIRLKGLFLSRKEAEEYLSAHRYDFSSQAVVYSPCSAVGTQYKEVYERAWLEAYHAGELPDGRKPRGEDLS